MVDVVGALVIAVIDISMRDGVDLLDAAVLSHIQHLAEDAREWLLVFRQHFAAK